MKMKRALAYAVALFGFVASSVPAVAGDEDRHFDRDRGSLERDKEMKDQVFEGDVERARRLGLKEDAFEPDRRPFKREE